MRINIEVLNIAFGISENTTRYFITNKPDLHNIFYNSNIYSNGSGGKNDLSIS